MGNTILCIEDNPDNMMLLRRILEATGHSLIQAKTGLEGVSVAENQEIDLILLDINLPDIDGYEVMRKIRSSQKPQLASVPIIVCSANALKGDAQKALACGCNLYMTKPLDIHDLIEKVDTYLAARAR